MTAIEAYSAYHHHDGELVPFGNQFLKEKRWRQKSIDDLDPKLLEELKTWLPQIRAEVKIPIVAFYICGSYVYGTAKTTSDIDIGLVFPDHMKTKEQWAIYDNDVHHYVYRLKEVAPNLGPLIWKMSWTLGVGIDINCWYGNKPFYDLERGKYAWADDGLKCFHDEHGRAFPPKEKRPYPLTIPDPYGPDNS